VDAETSMAGQREATDVNLQLVVRHLSGSGQHFATAFLHAAANAMQMLLHQPEQGRGRVPHMHAWLTRIKTCIYDWAACQLSLCCLLGLRKWVQNVRGEGKQGRAQQACKLAAGLRI